MASDAGSSRAKEPRDSLEKLHSITQDVQSAARSTPELRHVEHKAQERRTAQTMNDQLSMAMTVNQISINGATNTRPGFLGPIVAPLLCDNPDAPSTVGEVLSKLQEACLKLSGLQILREVPRVHISQSSQVDASTRPSDVDIAIGLRELPRLKLQTGTDVGNSEGSAYGSLLWRNMFGGAEMLTLNAKTGTRTRSAYSANLSAPVQSDPNRRISLECLASAAEKPWASHEEVTTGGSLRFSWRNRRSDTHTLEYSGLWRQVTGLSAVASPTVRLDAGNTVKSAIKHTFLREKRDNPQLPQDGYMVRSTWEVAGIGPLAGDVAFSKSEMEMSGAIPVALPGFPGRTGISIGAGVRMGLLWPLPLGFGPSSKSLPSRINDRFQLGGPTDIRGFTLGGLGPHDGQDSVGGDVFAAGSVNMLLPLPYRGPDSRLRFQLFVNGGRLVALEDGQDGKETGSQGMSAAGVRQGMLRAAGALVDGAASMAAGAGLVYAHPVARFELNFSLPLVMRRGETATKGLQMGVGISFL